MKRFIIYITSILITASAMTACMKFDEMGKNPYALYETTTESFVQPILYNVEYQVLNAECNILGHLMQYTVSTNYEATAQLAYNYAISDQYNTYLWNIYKQFGDANYMYSKACEGDNPALKGVALILRTYIAALITDTYGNVPYSKAGLINLQGDKFDYMIPYDNQKDIYVDMIRSLEKANEYFLEAEDLVSVTPSLDFNFDANCDYTYYGNIDKWRRFGNSLYARLLNRVVLKVLEESGGELSLGGDYGDINVLYKLAELYNSFVSGEGQYPMMRGIDDSARVKFDKMNSALYTPFYSTTSGSWKSSAACSTIVDKMIFRDAAGSVSIADPRFYRIFTKDKGAPTQIMRSDMRAFFEDPANNSKNGNSLIGRYTRGDVTGEHIGDMQNAPSYAMMNYDELCFIFAEAGIRGWIPMSGSEYKGLYLKGCRASIDQWQVDWEQAKDYLAPDCKTINDYISYLDTEFKDTLEDIMWQKYIATLWVGVESWADYRRTGYPLLKTNGPAAENKGILPTRLRYPTTESFQNATYYNEAVDSWLGGENNMLVDMWWASSTESELNRAKGRE